MVGGIDPAALSSLNGGGPKLNQSQSDELRESFLLLLTTQLQNQDPLNPLENHEMTSQIAQINTVSGIEQLNQTLKGITAQMDANQAMQATHLIGQGVLVKGDRVLLEQGEAGQAHTTPFGIELEKPAENVRVTITNASGQVVSRYDIGSVKAGVESFQWDGKTSEGDSAAPGSYRVRLEATDRDGESISAQALNYAMVGGVTPKDSNGNVRLDLGAVYGQVGLNDIKQIL
ncbi:flagellar hook assembly protein FlgD [Halomonas campisalis]|uniref:Basal-body rod modification protein FlgD n=1 Tax=Billgrantia campisalis TaxID=74661 RepID=A0ABS9P599_9GAMM|nr:flagellar hook assembly protein FlgD [Halomonas campisalis]MCG6656265.1 flagellar hook assembly protein FlgD [Halomonas campisalis]MDR5861452.1 flagellar hook assembly protein FlgD [Halomonas campisalis]